MTLAEPKDRPHQVLVVDDEETIVFVLRSLVSNMGCDVTTTGSGTEVLELVERDRFSVVLLDIVLPGLNGIEVLDHIKQVSPDTEVIIMTSNASVETAIEAIRRGAYDYIHKPFELDEVSATVNRALEKRTLALRNRTLLDELGRRNDDLSATIKRLSSLTAAGIGMSGLESQHDLLSFFLDIVTDELGVSRVSVMLLDHEGVLRIAAARGLSDEVVRDTRVKIGEGVAGKVIRTGRPVIVGDQDLAPAEGQGAVQDVPGPYLSLPIMLSMPIRSAAGVIGTVNVTSRESGIPFAEEDVQFLAGLAGQLAVAVERAGHFDLLQKAMASLTQTQEQLIASAGLKALGELAAGVAHDFNNNLNALLGNTQLALRALTRTPPDPDEARSYLETIEKLSRQAALTVRRVQDSARTQSQQPPQPIDVNEAVRLAVELTRPKWKEECEVLGRTVMVQEELGSVPPILADCQELAQVVSNLIFNSIEAMPSGGHIILRTRYRDDGVEVDVEDTGVGMSSEVKDHVFDPFFTTKAGGHGLGLSVARGIVGRIGGTIGVESEPGLGTCFTMRFSAAEPSARPAAPDVPEVLDAPVGVRILFVEDEQQNRDVFQTMLAQEGHHTLFAQGAEEALQLLEDHTVDLMITDLSMPGMSGWELITAVRRKLPALPIAIVSGWGAQLDETRLQAAGVSRVLGKPVGIDELLECVRACVTGIPRAA
jgi:signal transduction histidine kinase/DNA-binding response OmpR family regulator